MAGVKGKSGRHKGIPELESGYVRFEVWKRIAGYLENHPKMDIEQVRQICLPIALKMMPEKLEHDGIENVFNVLIQSVEQVKDKRNRLLNELQP